MRKFIPVIGLEVHAQISSNSKLFSRSSTLFASPPNTKVSFFDASFPGQLPKINEYCVEQAIKTSLSLNGKISKISQFDRKHYFYPDLPLGYQITQYFEPIMKNGYLDIELPNQTKRIQITRLQIEQDSGKSIHDQDEKYSLIDLNRAGVGLMEIVTSPDFSSSKEAEIFMKTLQSLLKHIKTCDGNFEKGNLRCDVNVSLKNENGDFGTRCEVKNVMGIQSIVKSIEYEIERQKELLTKGQQIEQETRLFDSKKNKTILLRTKENAPDYRFLPDPDLPLLKLKDEFIDRIKKEMIENPKEIIERIMNQYQLDKYESNLLFHSQGIQYFEELTKNRNSKKCLHWIMNDLLGILNRDEKNIDESNVSPNQLGSIIDLVEENKISKKIGKEILLKMYQGEKKLASEMLNETNTMDSDVNEIERLIDEVLKEVDIERLKSNERSFGFCVGKVLSKSKKLNPKLVSEILKEKIKKLT